MSKFINFSFIVSIFLPLSQISLGFVDLYYYYVLVIVLFPILLFKYRTIDFGLFAVLLFLFVTGLINVSLGNNELFSFSKIYLSITIFYCFYFYIIKSKDFDLAYLFRLYFKASLVTAFIGFVQFFSYLVRFKPGYNLSWLGLRVIAPGELGGNLLYPIHSITSEPAAFSLLLAPAVYMSLFSFTKKELPFPISKSQAILIISSFILTQSSTGFFALFIALILINFHRINFSRVLIASVTLSAVFITLYSVSIKFKDRLDSSIGLLTGEIIADAIEGGDTNGSSLILFNHFIIAKKNASDHPFGTGLGSHHVAFYKYNTLKAWFTGFGPDATVLNINDANSLFSRILSETGYVGIFLTILFIMKYFIRSGPPYLVMINHSCLVAIFTALLRQGHYFILGLPFFILCYYYSAEFVKQNGNEKYIDQ
ncbi:hypothetical protein [Dyadobacter sp. LHD-138]|uniref:hypothetical protein n=1 Tax=Dyadobacter sp. LHD-138 TaxID=3071413 RepID=UPI0027E11116|nr:hypothetical protein [Dyadobacter sp. LHD-138]MDQ6481885.1 hypothetical protein [Dyadobacter sp. LHD-138]